jgi:hypothetical protein
MLLTPKDFEPTVPRCCATCRWGKFTENYEANTVYALTFQCVRDTKIAYCLDDDDQWLWVCARYRIAEMYR